MTADLYLYGIVLDDCELPAVVGVQGQPLRRINSGGIAALVGDLQPVEVLGDPSDLVAHTTVLDAVAAHDPVLPLAFGTVVAGDANIAADVLAPREQEYREALERLRGHVQYTVRVRVERDVVLREILQENREAAGLREQIAGTTEDQTRPQRIRLGEIVVRTLESRRPAESASILERLRETTADLSLRNVGSAEDVVEAAVLVRPNDVEAFEDVVEDLAEERHERMRVRLVGPQAPYDFVPEI